MGVTGKLVVEVDIKASGDVFHELFGANPHHIPNMSPDQIHGCDLHEGDFGKPGSIIEWEYTCEGEKCIARELVEEVDEEKKLVRYKLIEGSTCLKDYKSVTAIMQVIPKGDIDAIMWTLEFEKFADIGPYPTALLDLAIVVTRDIEAHHVQ
ncbi:hypothetical protein vseg_006367 [Gypsophila vaccaria]